MFLDGACWHSPSETQAAPASFSGQLEAQQHAQLVNTLLSTLTQSETPEALADNWQCIATHFDVLLDRLEAVDVFEKTIL